MKSLSHYYDHFHDKLGYLGKIIKFVSGFMEKLKELEEKIFEMGPFMAIQVIEIISNDSIFSIYIIGMGKVF